MKELPLLSHCGYLPSSFLPAFLLSNHHRNKLKFVVSNPFFILLLRKPSSRSDFLEGSYAQNSPIYPLCFTCWRLWMKRWHLYVISCSPVLDADSVGVLSSIREFSFVVPLLAASPMADNRRSGVAPLLDIERILQEAQHRWLRPAEICEILRNYHKFRIASEPPNKPTSGSLFLFDRKVLRYFRKDGHNWRKKKDGKTVKEAHEKLKAGSIDVLHCYYAHGEDKEGFQRRSYWMLEGELMHIVLVHYREVKGSKASFIQQKEDGEAVRNLNLDSPPVGSNSSTNPSHVPSQVTDYGTPKGTQQSEYVDADSVYLKRSLMQQIIAKQVPDTTLSLRCSSMELG